MYFDTSYKTVRYHTNLPYNCIYYVPRKGEVLSEEIIEVLDPLETPKSALRYYRCQETQTKLQGFGFDFCLLRPEMFINDSQQHPAGSPEALAMNTLRDIFPIPDQGCFVVNLLPEKADTHNYQDFGCDTLFIGINDYESPIAPYSFAELAAQENFKRMMGMSEEEYERREEAEKQMGVFERMMSQHGSVGGMMEFQTTHKRSRVHAEVVSRNREQVKNYYLDKFSEMINGPEPSFEQLMELIAAGYDDGNNTDKLQEPCPICAGYFEETDSYEVFLCPPNDEPIVCEFERGVQTKTLFIFFLRHADGIRLKDLESEESMDELARIYHKLKICDMQEANRKAVALAMTQTRSQAISDIRNLFNGLFVKSVASQYCIAPMDGKRNDGLYGITLDEEFIDLCKPFDKAVIEE